MAPFAQEHSCRLENPNKYDKFNRVNCQQKHDGKCIDVLFGIKGNKSEVQALRYKKNIWTETAAKAHCKTREGAFEPALKKTIEESNMDLTRILTKSAEGDFEEQYFSTKQLQDFFTKNTDKDGTVTKEIVVFDEATFEVNTEKDFKVTNDKPGRIEMIMSDSSLDRSFERIDQSGWKLANFRKNPVMLFAHQQRIPAIGTMEKVAVRDNKLRGFPMFDTRENDPFAGMIGEKVQRRILRAGSVGFRVLKVEFIENPKDPTRFFIREAELFEFSIVNVPALPTALSRRVADEDKIEIDALKKTVEENSMMAREREKEISKDIDERVKKCMEEIKASVKELDDLKIEVLANKSSNVNNLFDNIVSQQTSGSKPGQQTSDPTKAQQTSELEGIVSK